MNLPIFLTSEIDSIKAQFIHQIGMESIEHVITHTHSEFFSIKNIPYSMDWNNPGSILDTQFVFSITAKVIEYHSNN